MMKNSVGVADGIIKIGGRIMIKPNVGVADGGAPGTGVLLGTDVLVGGMTGVGGAAITASAAGIQVAVVILPATHP